MRATIVIPWIKAPDATAGETDRMASLRSALDQTRDDVEILLAGAAPLPDGASDDPRVRRLPEVEATHDPLAHGLSEARGEWIRFLPVGDELRPDATDRQLAALREQPGVAAILGWTETGSTNGDGPPTEIRTDATETESLIPELLGRAELGTLATTLWRVGTLRALGAAGEGWLRGPTLALWLEVLQHHTATVVPVAVARVRLPATTDDGRARVLRDQWIRDRGARWRRAVGSDGTDPHREGVANLSVAARILENRSDEILPIAAELVSEARAAGFTLPEGIAFERLRRAAPELARRSDGWISGGWPGTLAGPAPTESAPASHAREATTRVAVLVHRTEDCERAESLATALATRIPHDFEPLIVRTDGGKLGFQRHGFGETTVALADDPAALEEVLASHRVAAAFGAPDALVTATLEAAGITAWPLDPAAVPEDAGALERMLTQAAMRRARRETDRRRRDERACAGVTLRARVATQARDMAARFADENERRVAARIEEVAPPLEEARGRLGAARWTAGQLRTPVEALLDKLRIGARLKRTWRALRPATASAPSTSELPPGALESFLESGQGRDLWIVYTTDPFSETNGQRSTWLTRELIRTGRQVLFYYWRWHDHEPIPGAVGDQVLSVPIDRIEETWPVLEERSRDRPHRTLLIEFPDRDAWEWLERANAAGMHTVYDCVDEWEEFGRAGQAIWYEAHTERLLAQNARVVVATNPDLAEKFAGLRDRPVPIVGNGVALDSLLGDEAPRSPAPGARVIGYFGHLTSTWFDWELIGETATAHPEWHFEIIGYGAPDDLQLPANVSLLGRVDHARLADHAKRWRVGIVPFREGALTRAVDPIKLYEYLALGLSVVAVGMPHLGGLPAVNACTRADFARAVEEALTADRDEAAVRALVDSCAWSRRLETIDALLEATSPDWLATG